MKKPAEIKARIAIMRLPIGEEEVEVIGLFDHGLVRSFHDVLFSRLSKEDIFHYVLLEGMKLSIQVNKSSLLEFSGKLSSGFSLEADYDKIRIENRFVVGGEDLLPILKKHKGCHVIIKTEKL